MFRIWTVFVSSLTACCLLGAVVAQDTKSQRIKEWGEVIDPASDCKFVEEMGKLTITIPGVYHDLNPTPRFNNLSAPRVLQEVEGDFLIQVKTHRFPRPKANTSTKVHSYVGAGLLVWHDGDNFVRLLRAANGESGALFVSGELYKDGKYAGGRLTKIEDKDTHLRLERHKGKFTLSFSADGQKWSDLETPDIELPKKLKVGVAAVNSTTKAFAPQFEEFKIMKK